MGVRVRPHRTSWWTHFGHSGKSQVCLSSLSWPRRSGSCRRRRGRPVRSTSRGCWLRKSSCCGMRGRGGTKTSGWPDCSVISWSVVGPHWERLIDTDASQKTPNIWLKIRNSEASQLVNQWSVGGFFLWGNLSPSLSLLGRTLLLPRTGVTLLWHHWRRRRRPLWDTSRSKRLF